MNIAIIGYGNMGREIERISAAKGITVVSRIDKQQKDADFSEINKQSLKNADVCIDFTSPDSVVNNVKKIAELKKDMVIGTTGWYSNLEQVEKIVKSNGIGLVYGPNFSIGVNLFFKMVENASKLVNQFDDYDIFGYELHHNRKMDSPSGTAKALGKILLDNIKRKKTLAYDRIDRKIKQEELHFASIRSGSIPGTHVIGFDSSADTIELKHTARNREGFALGAVMAAKWINGKKGIYSFEKIFEKL